MKNNKKFLLAMLGMMLALGLVLALSSCKPDDEEEKRSNPALGETFEIKGKVYGVSWSGVSASYTPLTNVTVTVEGPFSSLTATVTGGDFTVTIPVADASQLQTATKENLAKRFGLSEDKITIEPDNAKFGQLRLEAVAEGYYPDLNLGITSVSGTEENYSGSEAYYSYVYVDQDVTIKGSDTGTSGNSEGTSSRDYSTTVNLSLKAGWNVIEESDSFSGKASATKSEIKSTTTYFVKGIPESAKWTLYSQDDDD